MSAIGSAGTVSIKVGVEGVEELLQRLNKMSQGLKTWIGDLEGAKAAVGSIITSGLPAGFDQFGTSVESASTKTQTFTQRMTGFQGNLLTAATSVGTFTASIFGIDAAMDGLTQSELSLEQARVRQDRMQTTLQAQELRLNELRTSGTATAAEIAVQEERVNTTRQQLEVQTERVAFQQQNLNEQHAQFASQILPQVITATLSGVTAFQSIFTLIGKSEKAVAFLNNAWQVYGLGVKKAAVATTAANTAIAASTTTATAATGGLVGVMSTLAPLLAGVAIGAASAVAPFLIWSDNLFGLREGLSNVGAELGKLNPSMKQFLSWLELQAREFTAWRQATDIQSAGLKSMEETFKNVSGGAESALGLIMDKMEALRSKMVQTRDITADMAGGELFSNLFGQSTDIEKAVGMFDTLTNTVAEFWSTMEVGGEASALTQDQFINMLSDINAYAEGMITVIKQEGQVVPKELQNIADQSMSIINTLITHGADLTSEQILEIEKTFADTVATMVANGDDIATTLTNIVAHAADPLEYHLTSLQTKFAALKLPPELSLSSTRLAEDFDHLSTIIADRLALSMQTNAQQMTLTGKIMGDVTAKVTQLVPSLKTENDVLQLLVDTEDKNLVKLRESIPAFDEYAKGKGIQKTKTSELTQALTEEEQKLANLAKAYFDLTLTTSDQILEKKAQIEWVENAIEKYDDEIESLKELQIEYGSNEQAVYGVNQATQDLITSKKDQIIQLQEETLGLVDVTKVLDGSKESQILLNEAMIEGKTAAADFVTELAKAEKQTEAYGKALSDNVLKILEEMPDAIGKLAEELKTTLPKTFESLSQFEGMIKPFDKDSIKEYKDFLKEMDVPKDIKKLAIKAADIWQDKDEIIKETEAIFGAMSGIMANSFEELDSSNVTSFLDEIENKVTEMEDLGIDANLTQPLRDLIEHIRTSSDPLKEFYMHFEELQGAMDPKAFSDVNFAMKMFGDDLVMLVQSATLGDFVLFNENLATAFERIAGSGAPEAVAAYVKAAEQWNASVGKNMKEGQNFILNEAQAEANKQGYGPEGAKEAAAGPEETAKAWEDAKMRIETASTAISTAVNNSVTLMGAAISGFQNVMTTSLGIVDAKVVGTQGIFSIFSTSVATYATSMQTNISTMASVEKASLDLVDTNVTESQGIWSTYSTSLATYSKSMQTNFDTFAKATVGNLDLIDENVLETQEAMSTLSTSVATYSKSMTTNIETWSEATVKAMEAVTEGAGKAEEAVKGLADAIAELKDKKVTITVDVQENSTSSGSNQQYGGAKLLMHPQYVFGGEGHKPELHLTFPLDQMAQSHAKDAFRLPFNIGDLTSSKIGPPSFTGSTANQAYVPSNLVSNLRLNANLHIDLGNEVRKIVREEINARAVTRLDRMAM